MAQFEEYLKRQKKGQSEVFRIDEYQKGLSDDQRFDADYDPAQLEEVFQNRLQDSTYNERTMYYFKDQGLYAAKARRYWNLGNEEEGGKLDQFGEKYTHHSASKRRKAAKAAGNAFGKATLLVKKNHEKEKKAKNDYEIFELREAIIRLRMEGMENAAEVKARNADHEKYLKCKAKVSCLMMLQDQLRNLKKNANRVNDQAVLRKFDKKEEALKRELTTAKRKLSSVAVPADTTWALENDIKGKTETLYGGRLDDRNIEPQMTAMQAKTLAILQTINAQNKKNAAPLYTIRLDRQGHPINKAEVQKMAWNEKYEKIMQDNDRNAKNEMLLTVAKRVERYRLPDIKAFQNGSVLEKFQNRPIEYYEMMLKTPDFLNAQMVDKNGVLAQYAAQHPVFSAKLGLLTAMGRHLRDTMKENQIEPETASISRLLGMQEVPESERLSEIEESHRVYEDAMKKKQSAQQAMQPQEHLLLETQAEQDAEYAALRQKNPAFTKKQYKVYKGLKASRAVIEDQKLWDRVKALESKYQDQLEPSRDLAMVLRSVHYDKNGKPISEEDKRRAAQNERWIKAWEADLNDAEAQKTKLELVMKELPNVFDGFDCPEPQNAERWFKKNMEERPFALQEMMTRSIAISNMEKRFPWITEYINTHPVFREKLILMSRLVTLQHQGIKGFYNVNTKGEGGRLAIVEADSRQEAEEEMVDCQTTFRDQLQDNYAHQYEESHFILTQIEEEKQQMRSINPELTDAQYDILKNARRCYAVFDQNPNYTAQLNTANQIGTHNYSLTREPAAVLRSVIYNSEGAPFAEADKAMQKQNDRWMKAWEVGDEETKQKMALEIVPHMFDGFEPPEPKNMRHWVDEQMHRNPFRLMEMLRRITALSDLQKEIPAVEEFEKQNEEFHKKREIFSYLGNFVDAYLRIQNIKNQGGTYLISESMGYDMRKIFFSQMDMAADEYEKNYRKIQGVNG